MSRKSQMTSHRKEQKRRVKAQNKSDNKVIDNNNRTKKNVQKKITKSYRKLDFNDDKSINFNKQTMTELKKLDRAIKKEFDSLYSKNLNVLKQNQVAVSNQAYRYPLHLAEIELNKEVKPEKLINTLIIAGLAALLLKWKPDTLSKIKNSILYSLEFGHPINKINKIVGDLIIQRIDPESLNFPAAFTKSKKQILLETFKKYPHIGGDAGRAITINRNEAADNYGKYRQKAQEDLKKAGVKFTRIWDAILDNVVRPEHSFLHGVPESKKGTWNLAGIDITRPKTTGYPEQDINCRCEILEIMG